MEATTHDNFYHKLLEYFEAGAIECYLNFHEDSSQSIYFLFRLLESLMENLPRSAQDCSEQIHRPIVLTDGQPLNIFF